MSDCCCSPPDLNTRTKFNGRRVNKNGDIIWQVDLNCDYIGVKQYNDATILVYGIGASGGPFNGKYLLFLIDIPTGKVKTQRVFSSSLDAWYPIFDGRNSDWAVYYHQGNTHYYLDDNLADVESISSGTYAPEFVDKYGNPFHLDTIDTNYELVYPYDDDHDGSSDPDYWEQFIDGYWAVQQFHGVTYPEAEEFSKMPGRLMYDGDGNLYSGVGTKGILKQVNNIGAWISTPQVDTAAGGSHSLETDSYTVTGEMWYDWRDPNSGFESPRQAAHRGEITNEICDNKSAETMNVDNQDALTTTLSDPGRMAEVKRTALKVDAPMYEDTVGELYIDNRIPTDNLVPTTVTINSTSFDNGYGERDSNGYYQRPDGLDSWFSDAGWMATQGAIAHYGSMDSIVIDQEPAWGYSFDTAGNSDFDGLSNYLKFGWKHGDLQNPSYELSSGYMSETTAQALDNPGANYPAYTVEFCGTSEPARVYETAHEGPVGSATTDYSYELGFINMNPFISISAYTDKYKTIKCHKNNQVPIIVNGIPSSGTGSKAYILWWTLGNSKVENDTWEEITGDPLFSNAPQQIKGQHPSYAGSDIYLWENIWLPQNYEYLVDYNTDGTITERISNSFKTARFAYHSEKANDGTKDVFMVLKNQDGLWLTGFDTPNDTVGSVNYYYPVKLCDWDTNPGITEVPLWLDSVVENGVADVVAWGDRADT